MIARRIHVSNVTHATIDIANNPSHKQGGPRRMRSIDGKEHRAPAKPGEIGGHQQAAEREARRPRKTQHDAINAERAAARRIGKLQMNGRKHLRHHHRSGRALRQPRGDQFRSGSRQCAP
jgi:hypothetical protein